jgi:hypothetical protein
LAMLASSSAGAQTFGEKGQLAISAERLFGFVHDSTTTTENGIDTTVKTDSFSLLSSTVTPFGTGVVVYSQPRVAGDYFVIDNLSLGGAVGYSHYSISEPAGQNVEISTSGDSWLFAPRVGYSFLFNDNIGIWPRGGFTYRTFSAVNESGHVFALTIEAPFTFSFIPHVVFTAGPTLDLGLTGKEDHKMGNFTTSVDFNSTEIGVQTALIATVW